MKKNNETNNKFIPTALHHSEWIDEAGARSHARNAVNTMVFKMFNELDSHRKHALRDSIREVTKKATNIKGGKYNGIRYISEGAEEIIKRDGHAGSLCVGEHLYTCAMINDHVYNNIEPYALTWRDYGRKHGINDVEELWELYTEYVSSMGEKLLRHIAERTIIVLITKEEDARLREAGLTKSFPDDWDGKNMMARYDAVGIVVVDKGCKDAVDEAKELLEAGYYS